MQDPTIEMQMPFFFFFYKYRSSLVKKLAASVTTLKPDWRELGRVSAGATVQSVLESPAEEKRTYNGNQQQTGHSLEVYEGKCSRGQLV